MRRTSYSGVYLVKKITIWCKKKRSKILSRGYLLYFIRKQITIFLLFLMRTAERRIFKESHVNFFSFISHTDRYIRVSGLKLRKLGYDLITWQESFFLTLQCVNHDNACLYSFDLFLQCLLPKSMVAYSRQNIFWLLYFAKNFFKYKSQKIFWREYATIHNS